MPSHPSNFDRNFRYFSCAILAIAVGIFSSGCAKVEGPTVHASEQKTETSNLPKQGAFCKIQFRRDILGASRELPVSPMTGSINGAEVSVSGRFQRADSEWMILTTTDEQELWIPRSGILLMEVRVPKAKQAHAEHHE